MAPTLALAVSVTFALVSAEVLGAIAMVALLVGVPLFVVAVLAVVSAYIQYDADRYLEELADAEGESTPEPETEPPVRDDGSR